jgi:hypothetical protein
MKRVILVGMCLLLAAATAQAQNTMLGITGFMHEEDNSSGLAGFPPSEVGDVLAGVGFVESLGPDIDWTPALYQLTWVVSGLQSLGEVDLGGGLIYVMYDGGTLDIVADRYARTGFTDGLYGIDPPNATAPGTFADGSIFLHGTFDNFYLTYDANMHSGHFEGNLHWVGGDEFNELALNTAAYAFAGTVDPTSAPVPEGYDLEAVGQITFDATVPTEESTWGQLKNLYR